jgi:hypothetical protein
MANIKTISRNCRYQRGARTASPSERFNTAENSVFNIEKRLTEETVCVISEGNNRVIKMTQATALLSPSKGDYE